MALKEFGDLVPGDRVMGSQGELVTVTKVYEEHIPSSMYRLEFDNGEVIEASGNHLWYVETSVDRSAHRLRVKQGNKLFKNLEPVLIDELLEVAEMGQRAETILSEVIDIFDARENNDMANALYRVASSIGHIAEENIRYQDISSGDQSVPTVERVYDAKIFFQQILALSSRKYRKRWDVIVGRVVTTEDLLSMQDIDIPDVKLLMR